MNINLLNAVNALKEKEGADILDNPGALEQLLETARDEPRAQIKTLITACVRDFHKELQAAAVTERAACKERLAQKLHNDEALDLTHCRNTLDLIEAALFGAPAPVCAKCGTELKAHWKVCPECGTAVGGAKAAAEAPLPVGFVKIPGGTFTMGAAGEPGRRGSAVRHEVTVSSFYMSRYAVTQAEYQTLMGNNPSYFKGNNLPVEQVSWYDAVEYCNRRSEREGLAPAYRMNGTDVIWERSANGYRLPTEAEWEYACRAGTTTLFNTGDNISTDQANYDGDYPYHNNNAKGAYRGKTVDVGSFAPNAWGLYDLHGNVWEWCWDWYENYTVAAQTDPAGPSSGTDRIRRGGSFDNLALHLCSANRVFNVPSDSSSDLGFRLVRSAG
jgi:formylglycine-generating enzyme required for sulfatase activity